MAKNKTVLLTGATGQIGSQFLEYYLKTGYTVLFTSREQEKIESLYKQYKNYYRMKKIVGIAIDLEDENMIDRIIEYAEKENIHPNILVNNARDSSYLKKEKNRMLERKQWKGEFLIDVIVPYELSMGLAFYNNTKLESIINIASMYGVVAPNSNLYEDFQNDSPINYGVCKSGLIHLTKELAVRLANKNIRVNAVSYGGVEGRVDELFKERYSKLCPQGKMLETEDVIGVIEFLSSDMSKRMTGQNVIVDGGWTIW